MLVDQHAGLMVETSMLVSWLRPACGLMVEPSMLVSWLRPDPHAGLKVEASMLCGYVGMWVCSYVAV